MKLKFRNTLLFIGAVMLVIGLAACGGSGDTIKIGVVGAHSGDLASYGLPTVKAAELVVAEVNANGGIDGKKVELVVEDDECSPEKATNAAAKVIGQEVAGVIGHICSGATKAALGIYKESNILAISPSATSPPLTKSGEYPNFLRTIAPDDAQARLQVDYALDVLGMKKIAVLHDRGDYGKGLAEFVQEFLEGDARAEVVLFDGVTKGAVDYTSIINKIQETGAEGIIYGGYHPEAARLVSQMRNKGMKTLFIAGDGVKDDTFISVAGDSAEGVYATSPVDTSSSPLAQKAIKAHKDAYGEEPGPFFINAYAAAMALTNAIDAADSTEYADIMKALKSEYVDTPLGKISFDEKGDAIGVGFAMNQVKNGTYVEVE